MWTGRARCSAPVWRRDARDLFPYLEEHLAKLAERAGEPLVLATPQMGQLPWFLRQRLPEIPVELVDTRGLCDPELARLDAVLGGVDLIIGFECVLRRLDAESRQVRHGIADLYRRYNVVGFETFGEQYRAMHLNQTFTGIAIGKTLAGGAPGAEATPVAS